MYRFMLSCKTYYKKFEHFETKTISHLALFTRFQCRPENRYFPQSMCILDTCNETLSKSSLLLTWLYIHPAPPAQNSAHGNHWEHKMAAAAYSPGSYPGASPQCLWTEGFAQRFVGRGWGSWAGRDRSAARLDRRERSDHPIVIKFGKYF